MEAEIATEASHAASAWSYRAQTGHASSETTSRIFDPVAQPARSVEACARVNQRSGLHKALGVVDSSVKDMLRLKQPARRFSPGKRSFRLGGTI
jgi:hypothetical protein